MIKILNRGERWESRRDRREQPLRKANWNTIVSRPLPRT